MEVFYSKAEGIVQGGIDKEVLSYTGKEEKRGTDSPPEFTS
jgi:hypothetical protein